MKRVTTLLLIALLAMMTLAGCGGDDSAPLSTGEQGGQVPAPDTLDEDTDEASGADVEPGDAETIGDSTGGQGNATTGGEVVGAGGEDGGGALPADAPTFLSDWETAGSAVTVGGDVPASIFEGAAGQTYLVDGEPIQVYQFDDAATAGEAIGTISPDGGMINDVSVRWNGTPHFYQQDDLIILYVGDDAATISLLNDSFGQPTAGGDATE